MHSKQNKVSRNGNFSTIMATFGNFLAPEISKYLKFFKQLIGHVSSNQQTTCSSDDVIKTDDLPNSISEISYQQNNTKCQAKQSNHNL